jgi:Protein of unknown function (DUF1353)
MMPVVSLSRGIELTRVMLFFVIVITTGCSSLHYRQVVPGELHGKLIVQWIDHDKFIFLPDKDKPLSFTRANGENLIPGRMYTDGGSIPRPLWIFRSYSPWGYAPAFIIHDWLFFMKYCQLPGYEEYDVNKAVWIMSEVMKTLMIQNEQEGGDKLVLYTVYEAVRSPIAVKLWETGLCMQPPPGLPMIQPRFESINAN